MTEGFAAPIADHEQRSFFVGGSVFAAVVTYNRKDLLCRCVEACLSQTSPPDRVIIFDNGSTDGGVDQLRAKGFLANPQVLYVSVAKNIGVASAFDQILRLAWQLGCGWVWVMDDDVIPSPTALEMLKRAFADNFAAPDEVGFLASAIVSGDGLPNNVPEIEMRRPDGEDPVWAKLLGRGMVRLRWTTLCSVLIPRDTLTRCGSINPDLGAAQCDIDFALRVTNQLPGYLVGTSVVTHLRQVSGRYSILREIDPARIRTYYYHYRNLVYIRRKYYGALSVCLFVGKSLTEAGRALFIKKHPLLRASTILRAIMSGLFFNTTPVPMGPSRFSV